MSSTPRSGWVHPLARVTVVGVLAAGAVLGANRLGSVSAGAGASPEPQEERVAAASTTTYCPGDPFAAGGSTGGPRAKVTGSVAAVAAPTEALEGVITPSDEPGRITLTDLAGPPSAADEKPRSGPPSATDDDLGAPVMARATEEHAPGLVAGQSFVAGGDRANGLAAVPCTAPTADAWLVGGGGDKGRQERLVLTNPGANAVTATVDVLGATEDRTVVVPARGRSVVLLDAVGGTEDPHGVHVTTSGGLVVPTVVDHHLDGLTPAGVETIAPTAEPSTRQVVPASTGEERGLVIGVPGGSDAVVDIRRAGSNGSRSEDVTTIPAGEVRDVELPEGGGAHSWVVESDVPVVAAGHMRSAGSDESDLAWSVATPAIGTLGGAALPHGVPKGISRRLDVTAADGPATADVLVREDGKTTTERVSLTTGQSTSMSLGPAEAVWVRPRSGSVHSAVLLVGREGEGQPRATSVPVLPSRVAERDVEVVHRR